MPVELIVEGLLALLLIGVIVSCFFIHKRLETMRAGQSELARLIQSLDAATVRAESSIGELKNIGAEAQDLIRAELGKGRALADELALITEVGDNLANRLENTVTKGRVRKSATGGSERAFGGSENDDTSERQELLKALKEAR